MKAHWYSNVNEKKKLFLNEAHTHSKTMPRAQADVLTADERSLLVVAAELIVIDIMCEYMVHPPHSTPVITNWNNKVQEELVHFLFFCTHI